jgi:KUP system potassium uptake protein
MVGGAALIADGVLTPAITVTSSIEGLKLYNEAIPVVPIVFAHTGASVFYSAIRDTVCRESFWPDYAGMVYYACSSGIFFR